jgi:hypothetical protein
MEHVDKTRVFFAFAEPPQRPATPGYAQQHRAEKERIIIIDIDIH